MKQIAGFTRWFQRWFCNGANLITLSRIPLLVLVLGTVAVPYYQLPEWYPWLLGASVEGIFWQAAFAQALGMIADGLDGWYARRFSSVGPTPEGQFLDQFIDKFFVWVGWWAISFVFYLSSPWAILYWWGPSLILFYLDMASCKKHWGNYVRDRGKKVNPKHGAVFQGKVKFLFENVVVCLNLAALCPMPVRDEYLWYDWFSLIFHKVGVTTQPFSCVFIYIAIGLAVWSLSRRKKLKEVEDCQPPEQFAEAST